MFVSISSSLAVQWQHRVLDLLSRMCTHPCCMFLSTGHCLSKLEHHQLRLLLQLEMAYVWLMYGIRRPRLSLSGLKTLSD